MSNLERLWLSVMSNQSLGEMGVESPETSGRPRMWRNFGSTTEESLRATAGSSRGGEEQRSGALMQCWHLPQPLHAKSLFLWRDVDVGAFSRSKFTFVARCQCGFFFLPGTSQRRGEELQALIWAKVRALSLLIRNRMSLLVKKKKKNWGS